jgi:lipopolysaccharide heptosyltransferase II
MERTLHRILIIRLSSVGDIALSSLMVRVLRKRFPDARIDYLVKDDYAELVRPNPNLTDVLTLYSGAGFSELQDLRKTIHGRGYDLIIDIHDSLRSRFICLLGPPALRVRKRKIARFFLVRFKVDLYRFFGGAPSVAERYIEPLRRYGVRDDGLGLEIFVTPEDARTASETIGPGRLPEKPVIGIAPSARHWNKMWQTEKFTEAAIALYAARGAGFLLFGSPEEAPRCARIAAQISERVPAAHVLNLAGRLNLGETAAAMDRCDVVISNDSGLMHIATGRKRKVVALFGPTVRAFGFFPFGTDSVVIENADLRCRPCTAIGLDVCPRQHFRCMADIPASWVVEGVNQLLVR